MFHGFSGLLFSLVSIATLHLKTNLRAPRRGEEEEETFRRFLSPKNKSKFCNLLSLLRSNLLLPRDSRLPLAYNSCDVLRTFCLTTTFGGAVLGKNGKLAQSMSFSRHFCSFSFPINFPLLDTQFIKEKNTTMKTTFPLSAFVTRYRFQQIRSRRYPC